MRNSYRLASDLSPPQPANTQPYLCITLLGPMIIKSKRESQVQVTRPKVAALLAYLACNPGPHSREKLADLLWYNISPKRYRPNLRSTLSRLPKVFKSCLTTIADTVAFEQTESTWVDVLAFQRLAHHLRLQEPRSSNESDYVDHLSGDEKQLVALLNYYNGPFLDGLLVKDAPGFSDWQLAQKESLTQLALNGYRALITLYMQRGQYPSGIAYAREMIQLDPLDEGVRRQLMVMLARNGEPEAAIQTYEALIEMLRAEFGAPPMAETEKAYARIAQTGQSLAIQQSTLPTLTFPIVGRQTEISALLSRLQMPDTRLLTITGLGGVGKTYLAVEVGRRVEKERIFLDGIVYISLLGLQSAQEIPEEMAQILGGQPVAQNSQAEQVCKYLADKEMLIIFDNYEHLLTSMTESIRPKRNIPNRVSVELIIKILDAAPKVKILVTSRQPLGFLQEQIFALSGMSRCTADIINPTVTVQPPL